MANINEMFMTLESYNLAVDNTVVRMEKATIGMRSTSKGTDELNDSLKSAATSSSIADSAFGKLIGSIDMLAAVKKTMSLTDGYTNTAQHLKMINDQTQTQIELQNKVFAAANRSGASYDKMAGAVSEMSLTAGSNFASNDETIAFTELLQKSMALSGTGQSEQDSTFSLISEAMGAGKLQGNDINSIMKNAPMVANAISNYLGVSQEELIGLSSSGALTADVIKNALFSMSDDINGKFSDMPMTFETVWNRIKNTGMQAFGEVFTKINDGLSSVSAQAVLNNIMGFIYLAADACNSLLDAVSAVYNFMSENWGSIGPIIGGIVTILGIYTGAMMALKVSTMLEAASQFVMDSAILSCPIFWIIAGVIALIAVIFIVCNAIAKTTGVASSGFGVITGGINIVIQFFKNLGLIVANIALGIAGAIGAVATNVTISFSNAISSVQSFWYGLLSTVLTVVAEICEALNKLPFVEFDYSGLTASADEYAAKSKEAADNKKELTSVTDAYNEGLSTFEVFQDGWLSDAFNTGAAWGDGKADELSGFLSGLIPDTSDYGDEYGTTSNPAVVKGTGSGGSVKVENDDEDDPEWLQKLANRDFVARIASNTLAPNLVVNFSGPITQEADVNGIAKHLDTILKEQLSIASEGVYQ